MLLEINHPNLESIKVYLPRANHDMVVKTGGSLFPFKHREIPYPSHVFAIPIFSQNLQTVYVRLQSSKPMLMPLILWKENTFWAHSNTRQILDGLVYGSTLIMVIYNLFLFVSLRDKAYFFYVLYILFFLFFLLSIDGNAFRYLWPESPEWANVCVLYFIFSYVIFSLFFMGSFLNIPINFPKFNKWLVPLIGLSILGLIIHMIAPSFKKHTAFIGFLVTIFILSVSIIALKKGYTEVRFFLIARMISAVAFLSFGLMNVGIFSTLFICD
jgi:two-component system, sensor histidine kinase LadS